LIALIQKHYNATYFDVFQRPSKILDKESILKEGMSDLALGIQRGDGAHPLLSERRIY
jgi:hypothetical protein